MATISSTSTGTLTQDPGSSREGGDVSLIRLRLNRPRSDKRVNWTSDTVDNEGLNKKKSKCCCIYEPQRQFDESSSEEEEDECENCYGHGKPKKWVSSSSQFNNKSIFSPSSIVPCCSWLIHQRTVPSLSSNSRCGSQLYHVHTAMLKKCWYLHLMMSTLWIYWKTVNDRRKMNLIFV